MFRLIRFRGWKVAVGLLAVYVGVSLAYFHIPWNTRKTVYLKAPKLDRMLMRTGYRILTGWDELALVGRDASVTLTDSYRADKTYAGYPAQEFKLLGRVTVLENRGYTSGYSEAMKNPLWVSYRIFDVPVLKSGNRPGFRIDQRTRSKVKPDDYTHSGFDRGHMAPNYGIATRYGEIGQKETFLMSNIIPQNPEVNRHEWKDLEMRVAKKYGCYFSEVWVITGPVFQEPVSKLESGIPVPSHYYKIIVDEHKGKLRALAFLIEADCPPWTRIRKKLVSIDDLEALTELDFFPAMTIEQQEKLESKAAKRLWPWIPYSIEYHVKHRTF